MGIVVGCRCGQAFEADAWLAGKVVQCPTCSSPIVVPTPASPEEAIPRYVPRERTSQSAETRELKESMTTLLVAAVVIVVTVVGISLGIVFYIQHQHADPMAMLPKFPSLGEKITEPPNAAAQPPAYVGQVAGAPIAVSDTDQTPRPLSPSGVAIPDGWTVYQHPTARFTVILPGPPEVIERRVEEVLEDTVGHILTATSYEHVYSAAREFRSSQIAPGTEEVAYKLLAKERAAEMGGSVLRSEKVVLAEAPAQDVILEGILDGTPVRRYMRLIARGNSVFELSCQVPSGKERSADIRAFLANYRLD